MARAGATPAPESPDAAPLRLGHLATLPASRPRRSRWAVVGTATALVTLSGLLVLRALDVAPVARLRLVGLDTLQQLLPAPAPHGNTVTILAIDEASLDHYGQWPWPRDLMAKVVGAVDAAGARLIAFDIVFAEPDRLNPEALLARLGLRPTDAEAFGFTAIAPDALLVEAIAASRAPVVLANGLGAVDENQGAGSSAILLPTVVFDDTDATGELPVAARVVGNIPELEAVADGRGFLSIFSDGDGVVRRLPTLAQAGSSLQTSLPLEVTRIALDADAVVVHTHPQFGIAAIEVGDRMIPTDSSGAVWLSGRLDRIERIPIVDLLAGRVEPERLSGRVVLIGSTALGLGDLATTAFGATRPGVEVLAHGIQAMLDGATLNRPGYARWLEMITALLIGLVFIYRMSISTAVRTAVWGGVALLAIIATCLAALVFADLLFDPTFPGLVVALFAVAAGYVRSRQVERSKQLAQQHLAEADRLIGRLVDATFDAIVVIDRSGRLQLANHAAAALPIFSGGLAAGTDLRPVLMPAGEAGRATRGNLFDELTARPGIVDLVTPSADGQSSIYLEVTATALAEDGATALVMRDVTARRAARRRVERQADALKRMTEDLRRQTDEAQAARAAAESANAAKGEFLMMMSHELRTPLNAVIGFAELMASEPFGAMGDRRYVDYSDDIRSSGVQLLGMIDMILEVIRLDSSEVASHDGAFEIAEVVAECCDAMRPEADAKSIRLECGAAVDLPHFLGDPRLMRQVLINLLSNAIKFTDPGGHVAASVDRSPDGGLTISVTDDGIGMSQADLERAETLLQQGGGGMVRRRGGVGVGLTLAKLATEKQGGRIELDSMVGKGTVVRVCFPIDRLSMPEGPNLRHDHALTRSGTRRSAH